MVGRVVVVVLRMMNARCAWDGWEGETIGASSGGGEAILRCRLEGVYGCLAVMCRMEGSTADQLHLM